MKRVKIYGAGSIGNHFSHAARSLGWSVDLCDIDPAALERTRKSIYPDRYGQWDEAIRLFTFDQAPQESYDLIIIGTPPDTHVKLAIYAMKEKPKALLIEKPLCAPSLDEINTLLDLKNQSETKIFTGYNHVVGLASMKVKELLTTNTIGNVETIDVEFREFWGGIFAAHPWLSGPADSYLGYWRRGGGASGEHSHAFNLWQFFSYCVGAGRAVELSASLGYFQDKNTDYDKICATHLKTETGLIGRVIQDVVTTPPRKWARIQGDNGSIEWHCGYQKACDAVIYTKKGAEKEEFLFYKTRPDDFIEELKHISVVLSGEKQVSPISLERGLETMFLIDATHRSAKEGCNVKIDYAGCASLLEDLV